MQWLKQPLLPLRFPSLVFSEDGLGRSLQYAALSKAQEDLSTTFLSHPKKVGSPT